MPRFGKYFGILMLIAIVGGFVLFSIEAISLETVALQPWFPKGLVGDTFAWLLLAFDVFVVGFVAYRLGLVLQFQQHQRAEDKSSTR